MLRALIKAMRPKQWAKNALVFLGIFFDGKMVDQTKLLRVIAAFVIFCLISSAIYLINDLADIEKDRLHPVKRFRPLASGALKPWVAKVAAALIIGSMVPFSFWLSTSFGCVICLYTVVMISYSFVLKNMVIIDVMALAAGFVLRVFGGTTVIAVTRFSPWLYVCTTLLALFSAINKRRHEMVLLAENANSHRASLQEYSVELLDDMSSLVTATALASYSFYTFTAPNLPANHTMMLTIPFVMYGIFRYLYLMRIKGLGGAPEEVILGDRPLLTAIILCGITAGLVIYGPTLWTFISTRL